VSEDYRTTLDIAAPPDTVFDYFVRPELLVRWMGDFARLEAIEGGLFSVDINGVLIRGRYVRIERPKLIEIAWGEAGNPAMPPGSTRLLVTFEARGEHTHVVLNHSGLMPAEAKKHAVGWPHFIERLMIVASGRDAGSDPWKVSPPE
jgi:uncharacterized protein YndB with AHSA1/START domain